MIDVTDTAATITSVLTHPPATKTIGADACESTAEPVSRFEYKPALDGLRALAVIAVIAYHFGAGWLRGGFLGVDLFFVLSGYLITSLLIVEYRNNKAIALGSFWGRRLKRLMPALVAMLGVILIWGRLMTPPTSWGQQRVDALWSLAYGANWHFINSDQSYFVATPSMVRHMWSLAIEEQFYLVWPLVVLGALYLAKGRLWALVSACAVGSAVSAWWMNSVYSHADPSRAYYGTDTRASQLLLGALCGIVVLNWTPATRAARITLQVVGTLSLAAVLAVMATATDTSAWLYRGGFVVFALTACGAIAAVSQVSSNPVSRVLSLGPVRWVGAISYGLYLWHWPISVAITPERLYSWGWGSNAWVVAVVRSGLTVIVAALSYYLLEMPIRRHRFTRRQAWVLTPAAVLATCALVFALTSGARASLLDNPTGTVLQSASAVPVAEGETSLSSLMAHGVVIGDSVAASIGDALATEAARRGVRIESFGRLGCGVTTAVNVNERGEVFEPSRDCVETVLGYELSAVADHGADVLIVHSSWEISDLQGPAGNVTFNSPQWLALMDAEYDRLRMLALDHGMKMVIVANAPPAPSKFGNPGPSEDVLIAAMNSFYSSYAAEHPDQVGLVELMPIVCPAGPPCPEVLDGERLRPLDGRHYEGTSEWVLARYLDALEQALRGINAAAATNPSNGTKPSNGTDSPNLQR